jgi:LCP family protein required for cell wall assembly
MANTPDYDSYRPLGHRPKPKSTDGFVSPNTVRRSNSQQSHFRNTYSSQQLRRGTTPPSKAGPTMDDMTRRVSKPAVVASRAPRVAAAPQPSRLAFYNTIPTNLETPEEETKKGKKKQKKGKIKKPMSRRKKILLRGVLPVFLVLLGVGGWLGYRAVNSVDKVFHGNIFSDATAAFDSTPLKGESNGRVNILLAGDSADQIDHGGADLTDSILILSIDTKTHAAFLLSIPRDLWVYIPGMSSWQKINAANDVTNFSQSGYPSGGMGQLEEIIQSDLGIPIDYYGLMDYGAFKDAVDAVGGVTVTISSPDPRGLYDPNTDLKLANGPVTLNGQEALNLARARGDGYGSYGFPNSDFDRTMHQRQLFTAVAEKATTLGVLANPVKISDLINTLGNNFQTDMSLQNVLRLVQITKGMNLNNIQSYSYSSTLTGTPLSSAVLTDYTDPSSGEEALVPTAGVGNYAQMTQYYQTLTSSNPIAKEQPTVAILNASNVVGLAAKEETTLQSEGFTVSAVADASTEYPGTMVVDTTSGTKPNSLKALQKLFPGTTVTSTTTPAEATEAQNYSSDFVVILGENWDSTSTTQ